MANKVKIVGYAKKEFYNNGIEYRNFSPDLVGNQTTSEIGTSVFTSGNFNITTNLDGKVDKRFVTNNFGHFMSLEDINQNNTINTIFINKSKIDLNLDNSNALNYAFFGSLKEYVRVSLENIIINWPASIYVRPYSTINPNISGSTVLNYSFDISTNISKFDVHTDRLENNFDINYLQDGSIADTFNETNNLRNLTTNYLSYVIENELGEFPIVTFYGASANTNTTITFEVEGDSFPSLSARTGFYHIKPNLLKREEFFINLNEFEKNLLNRNSSPKYTSEFKIYSEADNGSVIESIENITWPVNDNYNIDFLTSDYDLYVNKLIAISDSNDNTKSDLMTRFLVSKSISEFDTIPDIDGTYEATNGQKMTSALKVYGREFDELKRYIDGISFANVVSYDKKNNTPDLTLKNLGRILGWDLTSSVEEVDLITNYLKPNKSDYDGVDVGLTNTEADIELWRRLILNTPWIWKSKGTRKAIEFLFKFIGTPDGLVTFNEYVYVADKALDVNKIEDMMEFFNETRDISTLNVDNLGFPKTLPDRPDMYFQKAGLWYRTTGGPSPDIDILYGNNPHIGPYDGGQAYIDQFTNCLVPNFEGVESIDDIIKSGTTNLFTNFNNGDFGGCCDGDILVESTTDIDFSGLSQANIDKFTSYNQISESACTINTTWSTKGYLMGELFAEEVFYTGNTIPNVTGYTSSLDSLLNYNELSGVTGVYTGDTYTFYEDYSDCITDLKGKYLKIEICLESDCISSGTTPTSTCTIITNKPFIQSGSTFGDLNNVIITDENGMSVANCFGISTDISTSSGETCNNMLEIVITEGVTDEVVCDYTGTTLQSDGLILLTYSGGSTSLNVHPDCCTSMDSSYTPEIGSEGYYVCRWRAPFDPTDCNNYTPTNTFDENNYEIFAISTGGTTTIVPSAECCYGYDLVDDLTTSGVKCKEPVVPVCAEYAVEANPPSVGDVEFTVLSTGGITLVVPTLECCTVNGLSGREVNGGYTCYNALNPPTTQITLNSNCCQETIINDNLNGGGSTSTPSNFDGTYYHYVLAPCNQALPNIRVRSINAINDNNVYIVSGSGGIGYEGRVAYPDTDLTQTSYAIGGVYGTDCPPF